MSETAGYATFLRAREAMDARSRHERIWRHVLGHLAPASPGLPVHILELGAGLGGLFQELLQAFRGPLLHYTVVDHEKEHLAGLVAYLEALGRGGECRVERFGESWRLSRDNRQVVVHLLEDDVWEVLRGASRRADLVVAQAFLDLFDCAALLPLMVRQAAPGGGLYFPITFDGVTAWMPACDDGVDDAVEAFYHATMDRRREPGERARRSTSGRHVLAWLAACKDIATWDAAGSDWIAGGRPTDPFDTEIRRMQHLLLDGYEAEARRAPEMAPAELPAWLQTRRAQVNAGTAILLTHQLDLYARVHISERTVGRDDA